MKPRAPKKPAKRSAAPQQAAAGSRNDPAVEAFLRELDHPRKAEAVALRTLLLGLGPEVRESIKWNAPSFLTTDHFATFNLREKQQLRLVLHTGARPRPGAKPPKVADPGGLLEWLGKDRALVTISDAADLAAKRKALAAVLRAWMEQL